MLVPQKFKKRKIVEARIFSVDERIKIMNEIYVIAKNNEKESTDAGIPPYCNRIGGRHHYSLRILILLFS